MSAGRSRSRRGIQDQGANLELLMDAHSRNTNPASLSRNKYTFIGNEATFRTQSQIEPTIQQVMPGNFNQKVPLPGVFYHQQNMTMQDMMGQQMSSVGRQATVLKADLIIVGNKTKQANSCCFNMTIGVGWLCIFPICFTCCMWWKKITHPTYQLGIGAYHDIANFISKYPNMKHLSITVADNAFNAEKARILYDSLSRSRIGGFEFINRALDCNGQFNQADGFRENMAPIKSLNMPMNIFWGDMIL